MLLRKDSFLGQDETVSIFSSEGKHQPIGCNFFRMKRVFYYHFEYYIKFNKINIVFIILYFVIII